MELVQRIKLLKSIQNFLPVMPSPILQEMFKQTTLNKITSINFEEIFRYADSFLGHQKIKLSKQMCSYLLYLQFAGYNLNFCDNLDNLSRRLLSQDLYIPYVAAINIWNNLLFGNLPKAESLLYHLHQTLQRCDEEFSFLHTLIFKITKRNL